MDDLSLETEAAYQNGKEAWPDFELPLCALVEHVQRNAIPPDRLAMFAADIFWAAALYIGDRAALAAFDVQIAARVPSFLRRFAPTRETLVEQTQMLRIKLLTGPDARIQSYAAKGPLLAWARVTCINQFLDAVGPPRTEVTLDDVSELTDGQDNPELRALKLAHGAAVQKAFEESLQSLSARDKTILRLHVSDRLGIDEIGSLYGVHRATAARWILAIRRQVLEKVQTSVGMQLGGTNTSVRSLVRLFRNEIHLSVDRLLDSKAVAGVENQSLLLRT
ncbi:MAG: hypothetical protein SF187_11660 [Deltaproteobacteria bacterium]|nr:hypothetical protein [Deltaproteobacteria bacterium]